MAVTIKDVAKAAGVSHATVSRALRGNPTISPTTSARVRRAATDLGYVPNRAARGLKTSRSYSIGVVIRRVADPFNAGVLDGIEDALRAKGYSLFLAVSGYDTKKDTTVLKKLAEHRVDGLILVSKRLGEEQRTLLQSLNVPTVLINRQTAGEELHSLEHDDVFGAAQLTRHLIDLGHRRIAYVGNLNAGRTSESRQLGYQSALTAAGIVIRPELVAMSPNGQASGGAQATEQLLALENYPTAIVCFNDMVAVGAMHAIADKGLSVPNDISVTGFDDVHLAAYVTPSLTTFRQPKYEIGTKSAEIIFNLIKDPHQKPVDIQLRGELIVRHSTRKPH